MGKEQPAEFYDGNFVEREDHYKKHYTELECLPVWQTMFKQLESLIQIQNAGFAARFNRTAVVKSASDIHLVDLGCGTGQFAQMAADIGIGSYVGIDFSEGAIAMANKIKLPESYSFVAGDLKPKASQQNDGRYRVEQPDVLAEALSTEALMTVVVTSEFLEHVPWDIPLLTALPLGTYVIGSVPNQDSDGHVRWFGSVSDVVKRYSRSIYIMDARHCLPAAQEHYSFMGVVWPESEGQGTLLGVPDCPHVLNYDYGL